MTTASVNLKKQNKFKPWVLGIVCCPPVVNQCHFLSFEPVQHVSRDHACVLCWGACTCEEESKAFVLWKVISCKLCLEMMMGSVIFILEEKAECDFSFFFLMNLNKKKKMFFLSVMHIIRNTWVCVLFRKISAGVKSVSGSFCGD